MVRHSNPNPALVELAVVHCNASHMDAGVDANAIDCENKLLNLAAEHGGTLVVVEHMEVSIHRAHMIARVLGPPAEGGP